MHNASSATTFRPQDGLSLTAQLFGGVTVEEIRDALAGLADGSDIALLKRVARWMRANGWTNNPYQAFRVSPDRLVAIDVETGWRNVIGVSRREGTERAFGPTAWYPVESVREAVDLLVMLGVLPVEFSSMYAAGRADRAVERAA